MKMKMEIKPILILLMILFLVKSEGDKLKTEVKKTEIESKQDHFYSNTNNNFVLPRMNEPRYDYNQRTVVPLNQPMIHRVESVAPVNIAVCPCASQVRCKPCGMVANPMNDIYSSAIMTPMDCPCAPRPKCPVCPPLSLLHEIASKKVIYFLNLG